ncbi:thiosulfate oxidation carrier protein SoxY [uncultured Ferrovibrio sp.]|jgi:sulfur-oxidizing protein SoxY|uniref:thiosulfate oxidation carrier protein SoxY n=1 Tax=uncultured Ferrovibrio sp. TaxID=1576913 RepID=UPI002604E318|nr:thiosulfate oxidation carrier protein SoxY [uncultured Ferrovibrio sp.]
MTKPLRRGLSRRQAVTALGVVGSFAVTLVPLRAEATPETARKLLNDLVKAEPKPGKVQIKTQEVAENGNSVPVTISVDSPMTEQDYVRELHVLADRNPAPGVASFRLSPANGKAEVQFRMRMAETQNIIAVAVMNDGSVWSTAREVKVTIGGCGS